jgi:hypothetical protein
LRTAATEAVRHVDHARAALILAVRILWKGAMRIGNSPLDA